MADLHGYFKLFNSLKIDVVIMKFTGAFAWISMNMWYYDVEIWEVN